MCNFKDATYSVALHLCGVFVSVCVFCLLARVHVVCVSLCVCVCARAVFVCALANAYAHAFNQSVDPSVYYFSCISNWLHDDTIYLTSYLSCNN